ncbi:Putative protein [Zobellia galactanivorans]|uniref:Uncharacterized protein n=1 Tax=Zobellia galactanivorans (strain DSM 12802 / CCUG 47099 / CIP 106680 / NCIMB 13871 / Dsij) TaxID=63186 RepID=G0L4B4_ZOBGA|nr:Putative protein [Zobellia galactanivorans]
MFLSEVLINVYRFHHICENNLSICYFLGERCIYFKLYKHTYFCCKLKKRSKSRPPFFRFLGLPSPMFFHFHLASTY